MTTFRSKAELGFVLENAGWPAMMVEAGGIIRRANQAALQLFGPVLESDSTSIVSILSDDNDPAPEKVLSAWERSTPASVQLKFRTKGGAEAVFDTYICSATREGEKRFLFQLYRPGQGSRAGSGAGQEREPGADTILMQKQKVDCATQLARSIALDFNNALTSVLGHCSWILSQMPSDHEWRKSMDEIEKAAEKAADIAHQLAASKRSEPQSAQGSGNINALVRRVVQESRNGKGANLEWNLQLEDQLYAAKCDEGKVRQAVLKIVENAVEASSERGQLDVVTRNADLSGALQDGSVRIEPGCYVCVEITDSGPGIPPEVLPRVFEPFFTTKPKHRGVGLAWAYGAITNQGGRISILSAPGKGTTARVYLPAQPRVVRVMAREDQELRGSETVLLVDDEELVLSLGQAVLGSYGYQVLTAPGGGDALDLLAEKEGKVDLVIIDWIMPRMTGKELSAEIRKEYPNIPILLTSGYVNLPGAAAEGEFLQKPFTTQELLQRVRQKLQLRAAA
jgi:two-component system, cell cycle sensor histidine kinase and response regulator CckA